MIPHNAYPKEEFQILDEIKAHPGTTFSELESRMQLSPRVLRSLLVALKEAGVIDAIGKRGEEVSVSSSFYLSKIKTPVSAVKVKVNDSGTRTIDLKDYANPRRTHLVTGRLVRQRFSSIYTNQGSSR